MNDEFPYRRAQIPRLSVELLARAEPFVSERAGRRYWSDVDAWARCDEGRLPDWSAYVDQLWAELAVLAAGLGELALLHPELLFPPEDP